MRLLLADSVLGLAFADGTALGPAAKIADTQTAASYAGLTFNSGASAFTIGGNNFRSNFCLPCLVFPRTLVLSAACPLTCYYLPL